MSSRCLKLAVVRRACISSCCRMYALAMTAKHTESLIPRLATNPMPDPCSTWKNSSPSIVLLFGKLVSEQTQADLFFEISVLRTQDGCIHLRKVLVLERSLASAVMSMSFGPSTQFSISSWNSSTEFRMYFQGITLLKVRRPYTYGKGPTELSLLSELISVGLVQVVWLSSSLSSTVQRPLPSRTSHCREDALYSTQRSRHGC